MQKTKAKIITALLLTALSLTLVPLAFASTGNIIIDSTSGTQPLPITPVPAGGNITLYFGNVTFSGSQFYLLLSQNGLSEVSSGDMRYTPLFNVAAVRGSPVDIAADPTYLGTWTVGNDWVNGSIPLNIAGGTYYIKAFDGATTALAVTQGFTVSASLKIIPASGAAGTSIIVSANAFPANSLVNFSYINQDTLAIVRFANLTATNSLGQVNITMPAPDRQTAPGAGDATPVTSIFTFQAQQNGTSTVYTANYTETQRGLLQFGRPRVSSSVPGSLQNATGLYGNLTDFTSTVSVGVGNPVRIVGKWFYPGAVTALWDNSIALTATSGSLTAADATGLFNATVTVPGTGLGTHNITLIDMGLQKFVVFLNVVQSITLNVTSGPIGTGILVTGYGFPAAGVPTGNVYNVTITIGSSSTIRAAGLTDASGMFTASFAVPSGTAGGANTVTATANDTSATFATATFTVQAAFTVSPSEFYANNTGAVVATGTGFNPANTYVAAIDNLFSYFSGLVITPSSTGTVSLTWIQAGFQPGLHVIALYPYGGNNAPAANATFTVLADPLTSTSGLLTAINNTVTQTNTTVNKISTDLAAINATIVAINGNVVLLNTTIGTMSTTLNAIGANVTSIKGTVATLQTTLGTVQTTVNNINANITGINSGFATVQTSVGTLTTTVSSLGSTLTSVSGTVGTISTTVGDISTDLSAIGTKVTSIQGTVATIETDLGTLSGTVTTISNGVATIQTSIGTLQADVSDLQTSVDSVPGQVNVPIWIAVVLALVAALAAIASLLLVRQKIAG